MPLSKLRPSFTLTEDRLCEALVKTPPFTKVVNYE